ncbi:hypothetical protein D3C73_1318610 [compost metagenome]
MKAQALDLPFDRSLPCAKQVAVRLPANRFIGSGEDLSGLLILYIKETAGVVRVVRLLRLHERLHLQIGRMRILGRFRLHELGNRIPAAIHVNHHRVIP